ncbi:MAG: response regulator [Chloroflexi bacterium]|nr:response regulator [Chloroflexota bacterium]
MKAAWIIEDDREMAYSVSLMLKLMEFKSQIFVHPRGPMLVMLKGTMPQLIILDMNLPEVSGLDVLKFIRSRSEWDHIAVVMNTVETNEDLVKEAMKIGADAYVFKPATFEEIERAVNRSMQKRQR